MKTEPAVHGVSPLAAAGFIPDAVHRDPEEPRLEAALFGVGGGAPDGQLFGGRREHGLRDLLGKLRIAAPAPHQREDARPERVDDRSPRVLRPLRGVGDKRGDRGGIARRVSRARRR